MAYKGMTDRIPCSMGKRIDDLLYQRNLNMNDLAKMIGVERKTIYSIIENGKCKLENFIKICQVLNVSADYLLFGVERLESGNIGE
ncbi:MAG: helix-turn-helix transcriptional regulator [Bacteroidales bacterium]|nr:helix-turn-helix transcriptional regulator [Candidatus Scybalousia scybalohippi]